MSWSSPISSPDDPHYTLPNDWDSAAARLALLGAAYDPASIALAQRLGVRPGWRCLEAGAGGGSFARWLCSTALPGGRVLAVDTDPRHLTDRPRRGGEVAQLNLVTDDIPQNAFDFIHTRFVPLHIADRDLVIERLTRALAPGGVLVLEEGDTLGVLNEMSPGRAVIFRRGGSRPKARRDDGWDFCRHVDGGWTDGRTLRWSSMIAALRW
ncbi:class I SAM-dependent methyltransferase [Nocardia sp. NPDC127526]|uniref:class I SAM-dependent methyltransferase n=1 Tax=Nocardia sp. NPDC127526 TaxID=3345393 RepID=UPI00363C6A14